MDLKRQGPQYLNVRDTARLLGVHENTVRNWARDGILQSARLPGSRFHRFDARDVERLRQSRGARMSSVQTERRTIGPELVDATQLSQWAGTRDAQDTFPELMRRLLASTPGVTNVKVRSAEGVALSDWDGRADSVGTAYLPRGSLFFEFSVAKEVKGKADGDYEKRRDDPSANELSEATFVFGTPRRWSGGDAWADRRRSEGSFADVQVLDADDLEGWLQATPSVHYWISEHLGRSPRDAETIERWWTLFQASTNPAVPAALFLAGRDHEREQLAEFFAGPSGLIAVQAGWRTDAIAFIYATIEERRHDGDYPVRPPLVVTSADVWDRVISQPGKMTLLPLFQGPDVEAATSQGHHVVLAVGQDQIVRGVKIELPRLHRLAAAEALEASGIDHHSAYDLSALARRSMPSLVRTLARDPRIARPPWSQPPDAGILAPLVLVGAWTQTDEDTAIVSRVAGEPGGEVERILTHWGNTEDPPFVFSGNEWHLASPEEALLLLRDTLTATDLTRWEEAAIEVLLEPDPTLELDNEDRPIAGLRGNKRHYSPALRRGLAAGIALLGSLDEDKLADGNIGADRANRVVRELLQRASDDSSCRVWQSLADVLPLLAEAAPEVFLDAVHDDLDRGEPLIGMMFQDRERSSALSSSSPHTGLLWALETLCWSENHLLEASHALARLQQVDPGGRLANRPLESLSSVFVGWVRQTSAPLDLRVRAVEQICRQLPEVGWPLLINLWPDHHATASPPHAARFRDWTPDSRGVPISQWVAYISRVVGMAIELAGTDVTRWGELVRRISPLPPADRERVISSIDTFANPASLDPDQQLALWESLHTEIAKHQQFSSAEWSLDEDTLSRLHVIAKRMEPTARPERHGYLFDWHPNLPGIDPFDHETYDKRLDEMRVQAVEDALESAGIDGLRALAARAPEPRQLGWTVGNIVPDGLTPDLLSWLDSDDPKLRQVAEAWASRKLQDSDTSWLQDALTHPAMTSSERREALALQARPTREVWDLLTEVDPELTDAYWDGMCPLRVRSEDIARAVDELLSHDRPWAAVGVLSGEAHRERDGTLRLSVSLVQDALDAAMDSDPRDAVERPLGYELGLLLDYLESSSIDDEILVRYEFAFFRLLENNREPRTLFRTLNDDPGLFVDLVRRVYRGKNESKRQLDERDEALVRLAYSVLSRWRDLPGGRDDGTVGGEHLKKWVHDARLAFSDIDRADIGDEQIGQVLASSPTDEDGVWPALPVREVVETLGSTNIETGIYIGAVNARGVTSRGAFDGGQQERDLAERYRNWAKQTAGDWPRTSRVLRRLAEAYEQDARREDTRAELIADTE